MTLEERLKSNIREVPDFPINGVMFKDISPLFLNPNLVNESIETLTMRWEGKGVTKVLGIESRGFLLGPTMAAKLGAGFVIVRKEGKLPPQTKSMSYSLEYGDAVIEIVEGTIKEGDRVVVHDDLLATGGTASAAAKLARSLGAEVIGFSFIINLEFLGGDKLLKEFSDDIHYLVGYDN